MLLMSESPSDRPALRWTNAQTVLECFGMFTYAVEPARLARCLPDGIVVDERAGTGLVSAVPFLDRDFRFRALPFAKVSCGQVNYRAYVRLGDQRGVFFFGTSLDSVFVLLPRIVWRMPWHRDRLRIEASWGDGDRCAAYHLDARGAWGSAVVHARGTGRRLPDPACFTEAADCRATMLDPFTGWYLRRNGRGLGRYTVWHEPLDLEEVVVDEARFQVFDDLDLLDAGQAPLAAGVQRSVAFDVHTPPVRASTDA
jgi:uncharacterized protein YqjF (DUF2071 family)